MGRVKKKRPDVYWDGKRRSDGDTDPEFPIIRIKSNDVGTANWGMGQFALVTVPGTDGEETVVYAEHNAVLTFKHGPGIKTSTEDLTQNMFTKLSLPRLAWHWDGEDDIICESQVDHIKGMRKSKHGQYADAVNYATYAAFHMYCIARLKAPLLLDPASELGSCVTGEDFEAAVTRPNCFYGVSSRAKLGVRHLSDKERKRQSGPLAIEYYRETGQHEIADWMETLAVQKPQEDAGDILHQARWYLEEKHKTRLKAHKKKMREAAKSRTSSKKRKRDPDASSTQRTKRQKTRQEERVHPPPGIRTSPPEVVELSD